MPKRLTALDELIRYAIAATIALVPLFFLPVTQNFYDTNKVALLVIVSLLILVLWSVRTMLSRTVLVSLFPRVLSFAALAFVAFLSTLVISVNKVEALTAPSGVVPFAALAFLVFVGSILSNRSFRTAVRWGIIVSASLLSLSAVYMYFGIGKLMFPSVTFLQDVMWTPVGSGIALAAILAIALPITLEEIATSRNERKDALLAISAVAATVIVIALGVTVFQLIPKLATTVLPLGASWAIALEMFKIPKFAVFGVGPGDFLGAFTAARPVTFNAGPLWNARFNLSGSAVLHLATTLGALGILAMVLFFRTLLVPALSPGKSWGLKVSLILAAVAFLLTPLNIALLVVTAGVLMLIPRDEATVHSFRIPDHIGWVAQAVGITGLIVVFGSGYFFYRYYAGEVTFFRSLKAAEANNGTDTYNLQIKAITLDPYATTYHIAYSQTNLALANTIASNVQATASGQNVQLSDTDRQQISQLIQQSIREGKTATTLAPNNVFAWETLANTYQNIMNIVQGSDQWAVASIQQAIQLDPTNPVHRLNLAGVYLNQNNLDGALQQLQAAQFLKPDAAVIYYNMAYIYGQRKEYAKQAAALKQTLDLLPQGSQDMDTITKEFSEVKKKLTPDELKALSGEIQSGTTNQAPVTTPEASPQAEITPKLELPQEASPGVSPQTTQAPERL